MKYSNTQSKVDMPKSEFLNPYRLVKKLENNPNISRQFDLEFLVLLDLLIDFTGKGCVWR